MRKCGYCQKEFKKLSSIGLCPECQKMFDNGEMAMKKSQTNKVKSAMHINIQTQKNIFLNLLGFIFGILGATFAWIIADLILIRWLPQIPIIPKIISWPVSYEWYATTGVIISAIFVGHICSNFICSFSRTKHNYGTISLSVVLILFFLYTMISQFATQGFSFAVLIVHTLAIATTFIFGISSVESDRAERETAEKEHDDDNLNLVEKYNSEITQQSEKIDEINSFIESQEKIFNQAKDELDDITEDDILKLLRDGEITQEQSDEAITRIRKLQFLINTIPKAIENAKKQKQEIIEQLDSQTRNTTQ